MHTGDGVVQHRFPADGVTTEPAHTPLAVISTSVKAVPVTTTIHLLGQLAAATIITAFAADNKRPRLTTTQVAQAAPVAPAVLVQ